MVIKISAKIFRSKKLFSQIESLYKNIFVLRNYLSKKTILLSRKTLKKELGQKKLAGWIVWSVWLFSQWKILGQSKILEFFFYFFFGGGGSKNFWSSKYLVSENFGEQWIWLTKIFPSYFSCWVMKRLTPNFRFLVNFFGYSMGESSCCTLNK